MFGCLGDLVMCMCVRRDGGTGTRHVRGGESVCLGRSSEQDVLRIYVSLLSYIVNSVIMNIVCVVLWI